MSIFALPTEVLINVFSYLTPKELVKTSIVCRLFQSMSNDEALWRFCTQNDFTNFYTPAGEEKWKEVYKDFYLKFKPYQETASSSGIPSQLYGATVLGYEQKLLPLLASSGIPINQIRDKHAEKMTLLHLAVEKGHPHIVTILLERGADPNKEALGKSTPLHCAFFRKREGQEAVKYSQIITVLIVHKANLNAWDCMGYTPLFYAARTGWAEMIPVLIDNGADPNAKSLTNCTPLHEAASYGSTQALIALIEKGADPKARDQNYRTPLHQAAAIPKSEKAIIALMESGADLEARDLNNHTPLHVAAFAKSKRVMDLLIERGADQTVLLEFSFTQKSFSQLFDIYLTSLE